MGNPSTKASISQRWRAGVNGDNNQEGANFSLAAEQGVLGALCSGHTRRGDLGVTEISVPDENRIDRGAVGGLIPLPPRTTSSSLQSTTQMVSVR
jgi:hypothetical protein